LIVLDLHRSDHLPEAGEFKFPVPAHEASLVLQQHHRSRDGIQEEG
jgi:hypothetical protein